MVPSVLSAVTLVDTTTPWRSTTLATPSDIPNWHTIKASNLSSSPYSWTSISMPVRTRSALSFSGVDLRAYFFAEFFVSMATPLTASDSLLLLVSCAAVNATAATGLVPCLNSTRLSINAAFPPLGVADIVSTTLDSTVSGVAVSAVPLPRSAVRASGANEIVVESDAPAPPAVYYMFISLSVVSPTTTMTTTTTASTTTMTTTTMVSTPSPGSSTSTTTITTTAMSSNSTSTTAPSVTTTTKTITTTSGGSTTTVDIFDGLSFSFETEPSGGTLGPTTTRATATLPERPPSTTTTTLTTTANATLSWFDAAVRDDLGAVAGVIVAVSVCFLLVLGVGGFFLYRYCSVARARSSRREDELAYHDADSF